MGRSISPTMAFEWEDPPQMSSAKRSVPKTYAGGGKLALEQSEKSAPSCTALAAQPKRDERCCGKAGANVVSGDAYTAAASAAAVWPGILQYFGWEVTCGRESGDISEFCINMMHISEKVPLFRTVTGSRPQKWQLFGRIAHRLSTSLRFLQ